MKKSLSLAAIILVAFTLISCSGKSKKTVASQNSGNKQEETIMKPATTEANGMAAKFMKSTEKSQEEAKAQAAEMEGFEKKEALFESAARHELHSCGQYLKVCPGKRNWNPRSRSCMGCLHASLVL